MLPSGTGNAHQALDYEPSFLHDVLRLGKGETEETLDARMIMEAKELGIAVDAQVLHHPKALSMRTTSSEAPRRSESINSRASQSTDVTSNLSEVSRDPAASARGRQRASLSFRDYDSFLTRGIPKARASLSFSRPTTPSQSSASLPFATPESSPKRHFRRIRGLSMLRLSRSESSPSKSDSCPHCRQHASNLRRAEHRLPCGHVFCTQALHDMVRAATRSGAGTVPSCCDIPIPGSMVEQVTTTDEQIVLLERLEQMDGVTLTPQSATSKLQASSAAARPVEPGQVAGSVVSPQRVLVDSDSVLDIRITGKEDDGCELRQLRREESELRERFHNWIENRRVEVKARHERLREQMKAHHETAIEDLLEFHADALAEAEDKQVKAEADLRETHVQEKRDNATALKHMEAYCAGTFSTGDLHNRVVTDQDLAELDKARRLRDAMDAKHSSAINVLRGEQGRRMKLRTERQERALHELRRTQRQEELGMERECTSETSKLEDFVNDKQAKMKARTDIQRSVLAKKADLGLGSTGTGSKPMDQEWQDDESHTGAGTAILSLTLTPLA